MDKRTAFAVQIAYKMLCTFGEGENGTEVDQFGNDRFAVWKTLAEQRQIAQIVFYIFYIYHSILFMRAKVLLFAHIGKPVYQLRYIYEGYTRDTRRIIRRITLFLQGLKYFLLFLLRRLRAHSKQVPLPMCFGRKWR